MPVLFDKERNIVKLDTPSTSYVLRIEKGGYLVNLYYGKSVPDTNLIPLEERGRFASFYPPANGAELPGFSPDLAPMEFSGFGRGDFRYPSVMIRNADGNCCTDFRVTGYKIEKEKPPIPGLPSSFGKSKTLVVKTRDGATGVSAFLKYSVFPDSDVIARSVRIKNDSKKPVEILLCASASLSLPEADFDLISLFGSWSAENTFSRGPLAHGRTCVSSDRGASSHSHNPFAILAKRNTGEDAGDAYGFCFVYSGNFEFSFETDHSETTRVNIGISPRGFSMRLEPGEVFDAPEALTCMTGDGIGTLSRAFHAFFNRHLIRKPTSLKSRPVLFNTWEAAYFDFDSEKLLSFAREAKKLGAEMLVMDDGWFGERDDDTSSLGDWTVDRRKLPEGLSALSDAVHKMGLQFGIWFEPEMVSPDSDLYRAHPDWALHVPEREKTPARHQFVLDVSRKDVRDAIYDQISSVLRSAKIEYVKWDFNRNLTEAGSALLPAERGGEIFHRFVLGTYELLERLCTDFPDLLLETCSGGGGRFDAGMLYYSPQIWTSDNTDPIDRLSIQFGTSLAYPASCMAAHVAAEKRAGIETCGNVALWGRFGFELDPGKLTEEEKEIAKRLIAFCKKTRKLTEEGDLYRLVCPWENERFCAWEIVSPKKDEALVTCVTVRRSPYRKRILKLRGLIPSAYYKETGSGEVYSGALLMRAGIGLTSLPHGDGESFILRFVREKEK